jgi:hypothetical protein
MIKLAQIIIENETNVKIEGCDLKTRKALVNAVKYFLPHARYSPSFKLGRWDGTTSFCTLGGRTYINLLDKMLPILQEEGYEFEIDDRRQPWHIELDAIDENYLSHIKWPKGHRMEGQPIILRDYQVTAINECVSNLQGLSIAPTSAGKCQPLYARIKVPGGWTTMGEIKVGDDVTIPTGKSARVIGVYEPGNKDVYEITFEDGRKARSCLDHVWRVFSHSFGRTTDMTLRNIIEYRKQHSTAIQIPLASMKDDGSVSKLPIHPYVFGALLGDGSFRHNWDFSSSDQFIVDKINSLIGLDTVLRHQNNYNYGFYFKSNELKTEARSKQFVDAVRHKNRIVSINATCILPIKQEIKKLGLDQTYSHTKFVPDIYLNASYESRIQLIQGLMDTDGFVNKNGDELRFTTTSQMLAESMQYLIRSVGGVARMKQNKNREYLYKGERRSCKDSFIVSIRHETPEILVSLPRKLEPLELRKSRISKIEYKTFKRKPFLSIRSIDKVSHESVRCIMIDHPDQLYLTDDFIVTHNTIITATLSKVVERYGRSIIIVPSKNLVQQTEEDYRNIGLDVGVLYGDRKEYDKTHTICTWQSLNVLDKKSKDALDDGQRAVFLDRLVAVICDEVHMVKNANVLHTLLTTTFADIPIRWGLTGTIPEEEYNQVSLYSAIGPLIGSLTARELQEQGHLAQCNINILQTQETVSYKDYQSELKHLVTDSVRLKWLSDEIKRISSSGNTLVLIDRIETGEILHNLIPESTFISGKMKATKRKEHYKEINLENNAIMIATYGTTSTGISINRIFNLILVEPGKSFVRVIQSIGRGLRKADDKDAVEIFDVASKCKFSNRHLIKRKKFYESVQYPYNVRKITY